MLVAFLYMSFFSFLALVVIIFPELFLFEINWEEILGWIPFYFLKEALSLKIDFYSARIIK